MANKNSNKSESGKRVTGGQIMGFIAFLIVVILVISWSIGSNGFTNNNPAKWDWWQSESKDNPAGEEPDDDKRIDISGNFVITDKVHNNGVSLMSAAIPVELFSEYGISPLAESAYTLTATVTPEESEVKEFTWSLAYVGGGSNVTEVSINASSENPLHCTVACNAPFSTPIEVKITYDYDSSITSSVQVDYIKRVKSVTLSGFTSTDFNSGVAQNLTVTPTYGIGTVEGALTIVEVWGEVTDDFCTEVVENSGSKYNEPLVDDTYGGSAIFNSFPYDFGDVESGSSLNLTFKSFYHIESDFSWTDEAEENAKASICIAYKNIADKNVLRACATYSYSYAGRAISSDKVYTDYGKIDLNNLRNKFTTVDGVEINGGNLYF